MVGTGRRRVLRWLSRALIGAAVAGAGVTFVLLARTAYLERPILGPLRAAPALANAPAEHVAGQFLVRWEPAGGGRVVVAHRSEPDRVLWASLPGHGFVAAGQGEAQVWESRAHFFLGDRLARTCARRACCPDWPVAGGPVCYTYSRALKRERVRHPATSLERGASA